jgi:hypothetical protein
VPAAGAAVRSEDPIHLNFSDQICCHGLRVGAHDVRTLIGRGGTDEVCRVRDVKFNRDVALKVHRAARVDPRGQPRRLRVRPRSIRSQSLGLRNYYERAA